MWLQAKQAKHLNDLYVATDSDEIKNVCEKCGAKVIVTSSSLRTGTDRVAQAYQKLLDGGIEHVDLVLNIQGDMPFINPDLIDKCIKLAQDDDFEMATPVYPIYDREIFERPSVVKVVFDSLGRALYFSRAPIPYPRNDVVKSQPVGFKHIGLYVFKPKTLLDFANFETGNYESREGLEQLRLIENGVNVKLLFVDETLCSPGIEIDTDLDVERALSFLNN